MPESPVILVSTYPPEHCGIGNITYDLVQALDGIRIAWVVANKVPEEPPLQPRVVHVWKKGSARYPFQVLRAVRRAVPDGRAVVHVNHHFFLYGGALSNLDFPLMLLLLRLNGYRVAVELHSVIADDPKHWNVPERLRSYRTPFTGTALRAFYRIVDRLSDMLIVPGASMRSLLVDSYSVRADHVRSVPLGWDQYPPSESVPPDSKSDAVRRIAFHGFLDPTKGLEVLLAAFAQVASLLPAASLSIIGEPSPGLANGGSAYVESLRLLADRLGILSRVEFSGYLDDRKLRDALSQVDLFVLPYTMMLSRGGSAVLSRIAGLGRPLIASRISRFSDELVDGRDAILVAPGDAEALATAILRVARDSSLARAFGAQLRNLSSDRSWSHVAEALDREIYGTLDRGVLSTP